MLAEIFMLRLEGIQRAADTAPTASNSRFVPLAPAPATPPALASVTP
jgi:hypothetical protein